MPELDQVCENCRPEIDSVFGATPRPSEIISGDFPYTGCCFVRDEIRFLNNGRLIFQPDMEKKEYCRHYYVICRRLVIVGGGEPGTFNPCGPEDPGNVYKNRNVITWRHRLEVQPSQIPSPIKAADGQSFGNWSSNSAGNNGAKGGTGSPGNPGGPGAPGRDAPDFTLLALEVEFLNIDAHLVVDFDGQVGGTGGRGQNGGNGGKGMNGRIGQSDTTWPGTGCDRQPGHGGDGGDGGDGGPGGQGGPGGDAGKITVISTSENISGGVFVSGKFSFVCDGGNEGSGGLGGFGGHGGGPGSAGFQTSECDAAGPGSVGNAGFPPTSITPGSTANQGLPGASGAGTTPDFVPITDPQCAEVIPLPISITSVDPAVVCRGFSTPANNVDVAVVGQNLSQVSSVDVSLTGVTAGIKLTSTDTQLDLDVDVLGNSALGAADLTLHRALGGSHVESSAIEVKRFEVQAVSPTSMARSDTGTLTITGQCFDPGAAIQQVIISGLAVTVTNVLVLDSTTIQCTVDVGPLAPTGARNVTVKTGLLQHTLVGGLTITT